MKIEEVCTQKQILPAEIQVEDSRNGVKVGDFTQQELLDRFHTLADKALDGKISESEKRELEMIEARLDAEDAEIYAPWDKYQRDRLTFLALQVKQLREISKKLDELLESVSLNPKS